jgi:hypothetical protein
MNNDPWLELEQTLDLAAPRYSRRDGGSCLVCKRGPHTITCPSPPLWWSRCWTCDTRWPAPRQNFLRRGGADPDPDIDDDPEVRALKDDLVYSEMVSLAACHQLVCVFPTEGVSMKTMKSTDPVFLIDPWPTTPGVRRRHDPFGDPDNPHEAPAHWDQMMPATRERLGAVFVESDPPGIELGPWRRLRARFWTGAQMGEDATLTTSLAPYYIEDPEERKRWEQAAAELVRATASSPASLIAQALRKIQKGGGALAMLRAHRDRLSAQIAALEASGMVAR